MLTTTRPSFHWTEPREVRQTQEMDDTFDELDFAQSISVSNIDSGKLKELLRVKFGAGAYEVHVNSPSLPHAWDLVLTLIAQFMHNSYCIIAPRKLSTVSLHFSVFRYFFIPYLTVFREKSIDVDEDDTHSSSRSSPNSAHIDWTPILSRHCYLGFEKSCPEPLDRASWDTRIAAVEVPCNPD